MENKCDSVVFDSKCWDTSEGRFCIVLVAGGGSYTVRSDGYVLLVWDVESDGEDVFIHELLHCVGLDEDEVVEVSDFLKKFVRIAV